MKEQTNRRARYKRPNARPVEALTKRSDIHKLRAYFAATARYGGKYCLLVTMGCNLGLRAGDLRLLTYGQIHNQQYLVLSEKKTGKERRLYINDKVRDEFEEYYKDYLFVSDNAYIFDGQKGTPIEARHIHKVIKQACRELGFKGNYGSHTLRKTFAYHAYARKPNIKVLNRVLNHSSLAVTRIYTKGTESIEASTTDCSDDAVYKGLNL